MFRNNPWAYLPLILLPWLSFANETIISGDITDPQSKPVSNLRVQLLTTTGDLIAAKTTGDHGQFTFTLPRSGTYTLKVNARNFQQITRNIRVIADKTVTANIQLGNLAEKQDSITVTADVKDSNILYPDPAQRVYVRQETLDANPGRPGAPISIPGIPIETASGGIKAPQYFSPELRAITVNPSLNTFR